jgi:hypothetical protein
VIGTCHGLVLLEDSSPVLLSGLALEIVCQQHPQVTRIRLWDSYWLFSPLISLPLEQHHWINFYLSFHLLPPRHVPSRKVAAFFSKTKIQNRGAAKAARVVRLLFG